MAVVTQVLRTLREAFGKRLRCYGTVPHSFLRGNRNPFFRTVGIRDAAYPTAMQELGAPGYR